MMLLVFVALAAAQTPSESPNAVIREAVAILLPTINGAGISGNVTFSQMRSGLTVVTARISGLPSNSVRGMHIHVFGNMNYPAANDGLLASGHFNPLNVAHQCPSVPTRHAGDMGNWTADASGVIQETKTLDLINLDGPFSIIGRSVILHSTFDDCTGTTGNAGSRLAQGIIGITNTASNSAVQGNTTGLEAHCLLQPTVYSNISGLVVMKSLQDGRTWIYAELQGFTPYDNKSWHIHTYGDIRGFDGLATGGHFNPHNVLHGLPPAQRHVGDLGNLPTARADGRVFVNYITEMQLLTIENVYGRAFIVHQLVDSGAQPSGNAGVRVAQGVIGLAPQSLVGCRDPNALNYDPTVLDPSAPCVYEVSDFTPSGGLIEFPYLGGNVRMEAAAGALASSVTISLKNPLTVTPPPTYYRWIGEPVVLDSLPATPTTPFSLRFTPSNTNNLGNGAIVGLYRVSGGNWISLNATYDAVTNTFTGSLDRVPTVVGAFVVGRETQTETEMPTASAANDTGAACMAVPSVVLAALAVSASALISLF